MGKRRVRYWCKPAKQKNHWLCKYQIGGAAKVLLKHKKPTRTTTPLEFAKLNIKNFSFSLGE